MTSEPRAAHVQSDVHIPDDVLPQVRVGRLLDPQATQQGRELHDGPGFYFKAMKHLPLGCLHLKLPFRFLAVSCQTLD